LFFQGYSQEVVDKFSSARITYPLHRSVMQKDASGNAKIRIFVELSIGIELDTIFFNGVKANIRKLDKAGNYIGPTNTYTDSYLSFSYTGGNRTLKIFSIPGDMEEITLPQGWYELDVSFTYGSKGHTFVKTTKIKFGIGEVFIIYGQSNAAGINAINESDLIGYSNSYTPFDMVNTIGKETLKQYQGVYTPYLEKFRDMKAMPIVNYTDQNVPLDFGFRRLERNDQAPNFRSTIYPRGETSWIWGPLGNLYANEGIPTLFINAAYPGRNLADLSDENKENYKTFRQSLQLYANILGTRGVLWHQGEYDAGKQLDEANPNFDYYKGALENLITKSRNHFNPNLTWTLSRATFLSQKAKRADRTEIDWENPDIKRIPNIVHNTTPSKPAPGDVGQYGFTLPTTDYNTKFNAGISSGTTVSVDMGTYNHNANNKFQEILTSSAIGNIRAGFSTDNITLSQRGPTFGVHFKDEALSTLAASWKATNPTDGIPISGKLARAITVSRVSGGFQLTAPAGYDRYFWVKNDEGIYNAVSNYQSFTVPDYNNEVFESYTCYLGKRITGISEGNSSSGWNLLFEMTAPFYVPGYAGAKRLEPSPNVSVSNSSGSVNISLEAIDLMWEASSSASWLSIDPNSPSSGLDGEFNLTLNFSSNTGSIAREGYIIFTEVGGGISKQLKVTQNGISTPSTSLPTLSPANGSSEWSGYGSTRFDSKSIDGNTMQVSGVSYYQGIGTHANSRMVYNLSGGGYTTFYGKVGRDDEADNGSDLGKIQFSIKTDGSTVWTSGVHGNTTGAESFSVNVAGKSTLELIADKYNDENYYDHANWMDVYLSGGGGTPCTNTAPTGISASPTSHNSGGGNTTLSASCSSGATVQWNTGHTGNSVTVFTGSTTTYTAKCVSGSCSESSPVSVTVTVSSSGSCSAITNDLVMGYWTVTGHALVAKYFHGSWWLVQKINNSPEQFVVRASEMLTRSDVNLTNSTYATVVSCFAYTYSDYGGLYSPNSTQFPTPSGYSIGYEPGGQPYYTLSGTPPVGCTDAYLTNSWTYASAAGSTGSIPKIGQSFDGNAMTMGSVNYSTSYPGSGIGTHATSEIIYDLGSSHSYTHFKSTVGKDNESVCGEDRMVFKVYNNATNALLATSPVVGTPSYGLPQTADMSVDITGVRYLKLVVEDGGDNIYCDHANWARARLACSASGRMAATDTTFFTVYPNVNQGEFTVKLDLQTDSEVTISLISSTGAVYKEESYKGTKGQNALKFNAGKVMTGLYHVRVSTRERVETKTVMIEK